MYVRPESPAASRKLASSDRPDSSQVSRPESGKGSGRSRTVFTTLKTAVFAAMPSARITTVMMVKARSRRSVRKA